MERTLFIGFMIALALAPLPYGSNVPWAWSAMALWIGALLFFWGLGAIVNPALVSVRTRNSRPLALVFLLLLGWLFLQNVRLLPDDFWHPLWGRASSALGGELSGAIGLTPDAGITTILRYMTYAGSFWLALHLGRRYQRALQSLWLLIIAGAAYAAYGLTVFLDGSQTLLGEAKWVYWESLTSTFVNRNSYAAYAGMGLLASLSLFLVKLSEALPRRQVLAWRNNLALVLDALGFQVWLLIAAMIVFSTALVLTGSRGGFVATLAGLVALLALMAWSKVVSRRLLFSVLALLLPLFFLVLSSSGKLLADRLETLTLDTQESDWGSRADLANLALRAMAEHPLTGTGLGSFASVYLAERGDDFGGSVFLNTQAHNTFLEVAMEGGIPAAFLLYGLMAYLFYRCLRGQRQRPGAVLAAAAAITVQLGFHSLYDFPLQIPALATIYFAMMGFAMAQSLPHGD